MLAKVWDRVIHVHPVLQKSRQKVKETSKNDPNMFKSVICTLMWGKNKKAFVLNWLISCCRILTSAPTAGMLEGHGNPHEGAGTSKGCKVIPEDIQSLHP